MALAAAGCGLGPVRHSAPVRRDDPLWHDARRADVLGLTPTAAFSTGFVSRTDVARRLGEGAPEAAREVIRRAKRETDGFAGRPRRGAEREAPGAAPFSYEERGRRKRGAGGQAGGRQRAAGDSGPPSLSTNWTLLPGLPGVQAPVPPSDAEWFEGQLERHAADIEDAWDEAGYQSTHVEPLATPQLHLRYVDGKSRFFNELGRDYNEGFNLYLSNRATARIFDHVSISAEPEFRFLESGGALEPGGILGSEAAARDDSSTGVMLRELTAGVRTGLFELSAGRMPMWWGPGRHGALLLSTNAQPLDAIKLSTPGPVLLPSFLSYLGLIRGEVFVSQLDDARAVPEPYLAGARVSSRILPWLEIGASRTAMFGGKGRDSVTPGTIFDIITAQTENDPAEDPGDQKASLDARVVVPWAVQPFEVYGEVGGEDEAGFFFSSTAYLAGLYLPRVGPWNELELTIEFADTVVPGKPNAWYRNANFPDGYTHEGRILGHHTGTDARDFFVEARVHPFGPEVTAALSYHHEEHFVSSDFPETLQQIRLTFEKRLWRGLRARLFYQHDIWRNFRREEGRDESGDVVGISAYWRF